MAKFHESTYRPTIKETQDGSWYLLLELYEATGISAVDKGDRQVAIVFPKGTDEKQVQAVRDALHFKDAKVAFIE
ncbi:hypothetical protein FJV80_13150 [Mesorhizobium sp. WSM4310]|uniref:hypothetical protein n=1 Tax=Mesorhizobium sp. WSM4310 TaxID=2589883 RepID=UPI00115DA96F|nr:hypothetical protein [Mesorhizobium sp. WSM4310]TRC87673.1 hypothetical protein FJV80_13150 [Mesorhizobium sp. WSM4310]